MKCIYIDTVWIQVIISTLPQIINAESSYSESTHCYTLDLVSYCVLYIYVNNIESPHLHIFPPCMRSFLVCILAFPPLHIHACLCYNLSSGISSSFFSLHTYTLTARCFVICMHQTASIQWYTSLIIRKTWLGRPWAIPTYEFCTNFVCMFVCIIASYYNYKLYVLPDLSIWPSQNGHHTCKRMEYRYYRELQTEVSWYKTKRTCQPCLRSTVRSTPAEDCWL